MVAKLLGLVAVAVVLTACGGSPPTHRYQVASVSMEPSLRAGDSIETVPPERIQRGDVVVARFPDSDGTGSELRIYRVVGLPGERISTTGGRVHINRPVPGSPPH
jgi:signal peptidase I